MDNNLLVKYFLKLARNPFKEKEIDILERNIGKFIHFTDSDRLGINYKANYMMGENPLGIYGFKLNESNIIAFKNNKLNYFYEFGARKYIYIFDCNGNILKEENINLEQLIKEAKNIVFKRYKNKLNDDDIFYYKYMLSPTFEGKNKIEKFISFLRKTIYFLQTKNIYNKKSFGITQFFLFLGIDAIEVNNESFGDNIEHQFIIFNPKSLIIIDKINNPMMKNSNQ